MCKKRQRSTQMIHDVRVNRPNSCISLMMFVTVTVSARDYHCILDDSVNARVWSVCLFIYFFQRVYELVYSAHLPDSPDHSK